MRFLVKAEYLLNGNVVEVANNILSHPKRHGDDATLANVFAPVKVSNVLNGNKVAALNNVARGAVNVWAPITATNILNGNTVAIANNILNGAAAHWGCSVLDLGVTVEQIIHATLKTVDAILFKLNHHAKRDAVSVYAPVTVTDILNCNNVEIANNLLNNLAGGLKCTVAELGVTVEEILAATVYTVDALLATLKYHIAHLHEKRGLVDAKAPGE